MRYVQLSEHAESWHRICWQQLNISHGQKLVHSTRRDDTYNDWASSANVVMGQLNPSGDQLSSMSRGKPRFFRETLLVILQHNVNVPKREATYDRLLTSFWKTNYATITRVEGKGEWNIQTKSEKF